MGDADLDAFVDQRLPNVAVYRERAPDVFAYLTPAVALGPAELRPRVLPWLFVGPGLLLAAVAGGVLLLDRR